MTSLKHRKGSGDSGEGESEKGKVLTRTITGVTCQFAGFCFLCTRQLRESKQTYFIISIYDVNNSNYITSYTFCIIGSFYSSIQDKACRMLYSPQWHVTPIFILRIFSY